MSDEFALSTKIRLFCMFEDKISKKKNPWTLIYGDISTSRGNWHRFCLRNWTAKRMTHEAFSIVKHVRSFIFRINHPYLFFYMSICTFSEHVIDNQNLLREVQCVYYLSTYEYRSLEFINRKLKLRSSGVDHSTMQALWGELFIFYSRLAKIVRTRPKSMRSVIQFSAAQ